MAEQRPEETFGEQNLSLESLDERIRRLEEHKHLGEDGSALFSEETELRGKTLTLSGAGTRKAGFVSVPFTIADPSDQQDKIRRGLLLGMIFTGTKGESTEQVNSILGLANIFPIEESVPQNKTDWDKVNEARTRIVHSPQASAFISGPSTFAKLTFFLAEASPIVSSTGTITQGGNTIVDSTAEFQTNKMAFGVVNIFNSAGSLLESHKISGNTANTITIDGTWAQSSGGYSYSIVFPILLGSADTPWSRIYVGDDIRLGYGPSGSRQYIKWGNGTPEGNVVADIGSMFLRKDGGANTTLYIKEANDGEATGWAAI